MSTTSSNWFATFAGLAIVAGVVAMVLIWQLLTHPMAVAEALAALH